MQYTETGLPIGSTLKGLMNLDSTSGVSEIVSASLIGPLDDLMSRPSKKIRADLIQLGLMLSGDTVMDEAALLESRPDCEKLARTIEGLHAGSLVIDDIADKSQFRRGLLTLHEKYGIPIAMNAGNWLYFWSIEQIRGLDLQPECELKMYREVHRTMTRAHIGQSVDVGAPIDHIEKSKVWSVCFSSMELKTGALFGLGISLGALLGKAQEGRLKVLNRFGHRFGVALQMFNDVGALALDSNDPKKYEDFRLRRPSWIWAVASRYLDDSDYQVFRDAVRLIPDHQTFDEVISRFEITERAIEEGNRYLDETISELQKNLPDGEDFKKAVLMVQGISERLMKAYG